MSWVSLGSQVADSQGLGLLSRRCSQQPAGTVDRDVSGAAGALLAVVHVDGSLPGCSGFWARLELVLPPGLDVLGCAWMRLDVLGRAAGPGGSRVSHVAVD